MLVCVPAALLPSVVWNSSKGTRTQMIPVFRPQPTTTDKSGWKVVAKTLITTYFKNI